MAKHAHAMCSIKVYGLFAVQAHTLKPRLTL